MKDNSQSMLNDDLPDFMSMEGFDPFSLSAVKSAREWNPQKIIIYGTPGSGKTTLASTFPDPILIRFEDGAGAINVPTFPKILTSLSDFNKCIDALLKGNHQFKTVIIDSLDWMEPITWSFVCQREGKKSIEDFGYGKGYIILDSTWHNITAKIDLLKDKGMNVIGICHASAVTFDPPDSDPYMTYSLKLHKRAAAIWQEWADMILFLDLQKKVSFGSEGKAGKAQGNGDRVIYTASRPAYVAKSRWDLPPEIVIGQDHNFLAFHSALAEASEGLYQNNILNTLTNNGEN